jgi:hypothetical protein
MSDSLNELKEIAQELADVVAADLNYPLAELTEGQFVAELCSLKNRRLLIAGLALIENDCGDSLGILTRSTFEFWMIGIYALLGGEVALKRINAQFHRSARLALGAEVAAELELETGEEIKMWQLARDVEGLLAEDGAKRSAFPRLWYDTNYRMESGISVHGGLLPCRPHFQGSGDDMTVSADPETDLELVEKRLGQMIGMVSWIVSQLIVRSKKGQSQRLKDILKRVQAIPFDDEGPQEVA